MSDSKLTALYLRVSSEMQREQGTSISAQRLELRQYAAAQGWEIVQEYVDEGESAKTDDRPQFQRMITDAVGAHAPFARILVYSLDRFARNRYDSATYRQKLKKVGVQVVSFTERFEDNAEGHLMEAVVEGFAQYYSDKLGALTKRGQKEVARRGFLSGGSAPFGYTAVKRQDGEVQRTALEPHEVYADVVRQVFSLRSQGVSRREIANWLDERGIPPPRRVKWSDRTIDEMTQNETYLGNLIFNRRPSRTAPHLRENPRSEWVIVEGAHPALVTQELFNDANRRRTRRGKTNVRQWKEHTYLLTGLLVCSKCGGPLVSRRSGNRHKPDSPFYYYACRNNFKENKCAASSVSCDDLDRAVLDALRSQPLDEVTLRRTWNDLSDSLSDPVLQSLRCDLADHERRRNNLLKALEDGPSSTISARLRALESEIAAKSKRLATLEISRASQMPRDVGELKDRLKALGERLHSVDRKELRLAIHAFVAEVNVDTDARKAKVAYILPIRRTSEVTSKSGCGGVI